MGSEEGAHLLYQLALHLEPVVVRHLLQQEPVQPHPRPAHTHTEVGIAHNAIIDSK